MNEALRCLIGQWIVVVTKGDCVTDGRLESVDDHWLLLRDKKDTRHFVYVPNVCTVDEKK